METAGHRRAPRVEYRAPVELLVPESSQRFAGASINLSEGGVLVETPALVSVGARVQLALPLAGETRRLRGRVVWNRPYTYDPGTAQPGGVGIEFLDLSHLDLERLRAAVYAPPRPPAPGVVSGPSRRRWSQAVTSSPPLEWPADASTGRVVRIGSLRSGRLRLLFLPLACAAGLGIGAVAATLMRSDPALSSSPPPQPSPRRGEKDRSQPSPPRAEGRVGADVPTVVGGDGVVTVHLPFSGSAGGATYYELVSPPGLALTLPHAGPLFSGLRGFDRDQVRFVRVETLDRGIRFRLILQTGPIPAYQVSFEPGVAVVTLYPTE